jgi:protein-tyrosine phosphatase
VGVTPTDSQQHPGSIDARRRVFGEAMDYAQVTSRLYVGSHPQSIDDIELLQKTLGITAILNLQTNEDMATAKLNWQPLESHYKACAVSLCRLPMKEEQVVLREKLLECVDALGYLLAAGHTVYLHCTAGIGRSPTVAVGYLHCHLGWEFLAAVRYMKQLRQCSPHIEALRRAILDREKGESERWMLSGQV